MESIITVEDRLKIIKEIMSVIVEHECFNIERILIITPNVSWSQNNNFRAELLSLNYKTDINKKTLSVLTNYISDIYKLFEKHEFNRNKIIKHKDSLSVDSGFDYLDSLYNYTIEYNHELGYKKILLLREKDKKTEKFNYDRWLPLKENTKIIKQIPFEDVKKLLNNKKNNEFEYRTHFEYVFFEYVNKLSIFISERVEIIQKNEILPPPKQPLTFAGLFKYPHNQDLEMFKNKLIDINLIDNNYQWRTVDNNGKRTPIKDIGKFYDWLYSNTIVFDKTIDKTAHCICFCAEFGIIAYEGTENKPKKGRKVTAKLIRESTFDFELKDKYNTHFKTWINKEK